MLARHTFGGVALIAPIFLQFSLNRLYSLGIDTSQMNMIEECPQ